MKAINKADLRLITNPELKEILPVILLGNGEPVCVLVKPEDVVVIGDMHPAVRRQFKAKERLVRNGMVNKSYLPVTLEEIRAEFRKQAEARQQAELEQAQAETPPVPEQEN